MICLLQLLTEPGWYSVASSRPTQSIIYVPLQVIRFQKIISLIVQNNYWQEKCPPNTPRRDSQNGAKTPTHAQVGVRKM